MATINQPSLTQTASFGMVSTANSNYYQQLASDARRQLENRAAEMAQLEVEKQYARMRQLLLQQHAVMTPGTYGNVLDAAQSKPTSKHLEEAIAAIKRQCAQPFPGEAKALDAASSSKVTTRMGMEVAGGAVAIVATHPNTGEAMWRHALGHIHSNRDGRGNNSLSLAGWNGKPAHVLCAALADAIPDMERRPDHYRQFNVPGEGTYETVLAFLKKVHAACRANPKATVHVS